MAAVKNLFFFLVLCIKFSVLSALEFCEHKYWCKTGHCCGGGTCCTYYYELWWFWLVWVVVIILSCCCFYQHKRFRRRQRSNQSRARRRRQRGLFRLPLPLFDPSKQLRLPTYEEVSQSPKDPPPYTPLNETTLPQTDLTQSSSESGAAIFQWPSSNAQQNRCQVEINSSDSAGLLDNEELPEYTEMSPTIHITQQYQPNEHYHSATRDISFHVITDEDLQVHRETDTTISSPTTITHSSVSAEVIPMPPPPPYTPHVVTHDSPLRSHEPPQVHDEASHEDYNERLDVAEPEHTRPGTLTCDEVETINIITPSTNDSDINDSQQGTCIHQTVITDQTDSATLHNVDRQFTNLSIDK
ncbi:unnamed protein product [Owenia fusiformis]|uniref:WW domain-binding protein 1-like n=1 Tax=Owenia fusiformis TaxID=6347 RepID=A0A8S4NPR3_OWEFU|nr:unnamed protein product [Owenia fusiformis]